jgi:hypothetical protein
MGPALVRDCLLAAAALLLGDCGLADSHASFVPRFLRLPEPPQNDAPDPQPDSVALIRSNLAAVFPTTTKFSNVAVSPPRRASQGLGWTTCVRASVMGMTGTSIGTETLTVAIEGGKIGDRRRAQPGECEAESFTPI